MRFAIVTYPTILSALVAAVAGCSEGKHPFRMVQLCLTGPQEIPAFTSFINEIAQSYQMEFFDRSGQTHDELQSLATVNKNTPVNARAINIGAERGSEFSFSAGNLGLPTNQIAIGFNGDDPNEAKAFSDVAVDRLSTKWRIHEVPQGSGALPLTRCE